MDPFVDGRVELDSALPEGASVTVLAPKGDETFEAAPETERMPSTLSPRTAVGRPSPSHDCLVNSPTASERSARHRNQRARGGAGTRGRDLVASQPTEG